MDTISFGTITGLIGIPIVTALVEVCKKVFPGMPTRFYPVLSIVIAILINLGVAIYQHTDVGLSLVIGLVVGLAASGLYSGGRTVTGA